MTTIYEDITEVVASLGMNVIVAVGFVLEYKKQKNESI
jgi:hypothetical protein